MELILVSAEKLKVVLTRQDMDTLGLSPNELEGTGEDTKGALIALLDKGKAELGFRPQKAKLFVEIYPEENGGCVVYFTAMRATQPGSSGIRPVLFRFANAEDLCRGAAGLWNQYGHRVFKSSLCRYRGSYCLILYPLDYMDRLSEYFLGEFGSKMGEGDILAAYVQEHGQLLIADEAIDVIAEHFA